HYGGNTLNSSGSGYTYSVPAAQVTTKFYDGEDRLVEVAQPYDASQNSPEVYTQAWMTRYLYDITTNGTVTFNGSTPFNAYGNLFETQELLPPGGAGVSVNLVASSPSKVANTIFQPMKGNAFDSLDRPVQKFTIVNNLNSVENLTYDTGGYTGLLTSD